MPRRESSPEEDEEKVFDDKRIHLYKTLDADLINRLGEKIEEHGGTLHRTPRESDVIVTSPSTFIEVRKLFAHLDGVHVETPTWVRACINSGQYKFTTAKALGRQREPFTQGDVQHLCDWIAHQIPNPELPGRSGNALYRTLVADEVARPWSSRHTWHAWREKYVRNKAEFDKIIAEIVQEKGIRITKHAKAWKKGERPIVDSDEEEAQDSGAEEEGRTRKDPFKDTDEEEEEEEDQLQEEPPVPKKVWPPRRNTRQSDREETEKRNQTQSQAQKKKTPPAPKETGASKGKGKEPLFHEHSPSPEPREQSPELGRDDGFGGDMGDFDMNDGDQLAPLPRNEGAGELEDTDLEMPPATGTTLVDLTQPLPVTQVTARPSRRREGEAQPQEQVQSSPPSKGRKAARPPPGSAPARAYAEAAARAAEARPPPRPQTRAATPSRAQPQATKTQPPAAKGKGKAPAKEAAKVPAAKVPAAKEKGKGKAAAPPMPQEEESAGAPSHESTDIEKVDLELLGGEGDEGRGEETQEEEDDDENDEDEDAPEEDGEDDEDEDETPEETQGETEEEEVRGQGGAATLGKKLSDIEEVTEESVEVESRSQSQSEEQAQEEQDQEMVATSDSGEEKVEEEEEEKSDSDSDSSEEMDLKIQQRLVQGGGAVRTRYRSRSASQQPQQPPVSATRTSGRRQPTPTPAPQTKGRGRVLAPTNLNTPPRAVPDANHPSLSFTQRAQKGSQTQHQIETQSQEEKGEHQPTSRPTSQGPLLNLVRLNPPSVTKKPNFTYVTPSKPASKASATSAARRPAREEEEEEEVDVFNPRAINLTTYAGRGTKRTRGSSAVAETPVAKRTRSRSTSVQPEDRGAFSPLPGTRAHRIVNTRSAKK